MNDYQDNEDDVCDKVYVLQLSHEQVRSLIEWIPKNYNSSEGEEGEILIRLLKAAKETKGLPK